MELLKKCIVLFVIISFIGCKKNKDGKNISTPTITLEEKQKAPQKVVIMGTSDDEEALHFFNVQDGSVFLYKNHYSKGEVHGNSFKMVLDTISYPRFLEVGAGGTKDIYYQGQVYIVPGDTILFEIKNKAINFYGKNAKLNNFYTQLYKSTPNFYSNEYKGDLYAYKKVADSIYKLKKDFFNNYIHENKVVSEDFIRAVEGDLKQAYLNGLISPYNIERGTFAINGKETKLYGGDSDGLMTLINNEFGSSEKLFNSNSYFEDVILNDFKDATLLDNSVYFKLNVNQFIRYHFNPASSEPFTKDGLLAEKKFIEANFEGKMKKFAIAKMIRDYEMKGFGYSINNTEVLKSVIKEYENEFTDQSYKDAMMEIKASLDAFNFKLSDAALNITKLVSITGDTLTLNDIFSRSNKRIRILDFWASWCWPCIEEIKKVPNFKDRLAIEKDVEWIYLSIDKDQDKWTKTSKELSEFLNVRNQYLIIRGTNSSLAKDLKVSMIPRYVIFNTNNEIVLENAPRPSDTLRYKKIINDISLRKQ